MQEKRLHGLFAGTSERHAARLALQRKILLGGGKVGRKAPDAHRVDEVAVLVGAVTSWCPGTSLLLSGSASAQPRVATHGEKNIPGEAFHRSGCYLQDDITANELLLLSSSRTAERLLLPASREQ